MNQTVVYTCIVGGYDQLIQQPREAGTRYVCFTDSPQSRTNGWEVRPLLSPPEIKTPRLINRYHKVLCYDRFPGTTETIYVDGNVKLMAPPSLLAERLRQSRTSIASLAHDVRTKVSEEVHACARKLSSSQAEDARSLYRMQLEQGFPDDLGLSANFLLIRKTQDRALRSAMERWWHCISSYVERDQLSLQYSLWAEGVGMLQLDEEMPGNSVALRLRHGAHGLSLLERIRIWRRKRRIAASASGLAALTVLRDSVWPLV
jgi:hypothetical protein